MQCENLSTVVQSVEASLRLMFNAARRDQAHERLQLIKKKSFARLHCNTFALCLFTFCVVQNASCRCLVCPLVFIHSVCLVQKAINWLPFLVLLQICKTQPLYCIMKLNIICQPAKIETRISQLPNHFTNNQTKIVE